VFAYSLTRRAPRVAAYALVASALAACSGAQPTSGAPQDAAHAAKIAVIKVDTSALAALSADQTATWAQSALPGQLARAFAPYMAPGDPDGATLSVRISSLVLGAVGPAGAIDSVSGAATLSGGTAVATTVTLDTAVPYLPTPTDQPSWPPTLERRVDAVSQAFAGWLPRKLNL